MNSTEISSSEVWIAYQTYLPRWARDWTLERLLAADKALADAQAYQAWCASLRPTRTRQIEATIIDYYHRHQLALEAVPLCHRTQMLLTRLQRAYRHGEISSVPSIKIIRCVVHKLDQQNT